MEKLSYTAFGRQRVVGITFTFLVASIFLTSCGTTAVQTADRPELKKDSTSTSTLERSSEQAAPNMLISDRDLEKYAYELGYDPKKGLTSAEKKDVYNRRRVRELERSLDSEKERRHYSKILPLLESDQEKIDYLSIDSIEGRQAWANRNKIWARMKSPKDYQELADQQDISVGMTTELVRRSWGDPDSIDYSGNEIYRNERWRYIRDVATANGYKRERRHVFFEGGRVVGWETD